MGKVPVLELDNGTFIHQAFAIIRHLARQSSGLKLEGDDFFATAQVDQWMDSLQADCLAPLLNYLGMVMGHTKYDATLYNASEKLCEKALRMFNDHLKTRTFVVGYQITLADIALASMLIPLYRYLLGPKHRKKYPNLTRHFDYMVHQPSFQKVVGRVWLCEVALRPLGCKK